MGNPKVKKTPWKSSAVSSSSTPLASSGPKTSAIITHGSVLFTDLPTDMASIYTRIIRRFFPAAEQQKISDATILEEADNATLTVEVPDKATAQMLHKRLQNAKVCGRRWKVQYVPLSQTRTKSEACVVECILVPPAPRAVAERALSNMKGFLDFVEPPKRLEGVRGSAEKVSQTDARKPRGRGLKGEHVEDEEGEEGGPMTGAEGESFSAADSPRSVWWATFADEGSALHARSVLSGRLVGSSGTRLFLERHR
ncbi:unnamed protein product [Phytomonas sp. EM1]|nr:unnamed protein product [Phytomonas sp. EM1]|eukprot:CCW65087.1 unnamed protein product [Phytomonas sp. isolate EM1]